MSCWLVAQTIVEVKTTFFDRLIVWQSYYNPLQSPLCDARKGLHLARFISRQNHSTMKCCLLRPQGANLAPGQWAISINRLGGEKILVAPYGELTVWAPLAQMASQEQATSKLELANPDPQHVGRG